MASCHTPTKSLDINLHQFIISKFQLKNTFLANISGGGVNVVGTSERYGSAADHVERYTMVDAMGRILLVIFLLSFIRKVA